GEREDRVAAERRRREARRVTRILVCECKQEVSSFNPVPSTAKDFSFHEGDAFLAMHRGANREVGGALSVFEAESGVEVIGGFSAQAVTSGGVLTADAFSEISGRFLAAVEAATSDPAGAGLDAIYFSLHGAMSVEGEGDPEGYLLERTREIVGEALPIVVSLDLHGVFTDRMARHSDVVVTYHTYPHIDFRSTGERAARALLRIVRHGARPVMAKVAIPALVRGDELITESGLFGGFIGRAQALEADPAGLSAGMFIGNPFTDVEALQSYSLVVLDEAVGESVGERAAREAVALAEDFWAVRERLQQPLVPLADAVEKTVAHHSTGRGGGGGTVILTDAADATSSGASGDSNAIIAALAEAGYQGRVLAPVVDPQAVKDAFAAGVGATIHTSLGGRLDPERFTPMPFRATVHLLSDGSFLSETARQRWDAGPTAVLIGEHATVVVTSRPVSLYDRSLFLAHGQNPGDFDAVVVKSPHCEPRFYAAWGALLLNVDAPGSTSANLPYLGHTRCPRPMFPLDGDVPYEPRVTLFRRPRLAETIP
ncbi:MAG TPA: M81 family metallopeptidase, partial [Trueperaceae bacterium]|nr:M81 family metallopeptidase [Trueperaceae bacterium]